MSPELASFLFEAANLLVLAGVLGWLLFRPVRAALEAERARREEDEAKAAAAREEAARLAEEASQAEARLEQEMATRRSEMIAEARRAVAELEAEGRAAREREAATETQRREAARRGDTAELAEAVGRVAAATVERLLGAVSGPDLQRALASAAARELAGLPARARAGAEVESAAPLSDDARRLLEEAIGAPLAVRVEPALGAGLRVTTPAGLVDLSARAFAEESARQIGGAVASSPGEARVG